MLTFMINQANKVMLVSIIVFSGRSSSQFYLYFFVLYAVRFARTLGDYCNSLRLGSFPLYFFQLVFHLRVEANFLDYDGGCEFGSKLS